MLQSAKTIAHSKLPLLPWKLILLIIFLLWNFVMLLTLFNDKFYIKEIIPLSRDMYILNQHYTDPLMENTIYKQFELPLKQVRERVNLILIVSTAPKRFDRRQAIRDTWWKQCRSTEKVKVKCVFMTDRLAVSHPLYENLTSELYKYNDTVLQKDFTGIRFGDRFLYHMVWAMQNYQFDYFMRMDDDIMFCTKRFIQELPLPPPKIFHWGWVHCIANIVRPEESLILLSRELIDLFLWQPSHELLCHPWADQMIGAWMNKLELISIYHHDKRAHHHPPASKFKLFQRYKTNDICDKYISIHGSYPEMMRKLWTLKGNESYPSGKTLMDYSNVCKLPNVFKWEAFHHIWRYQPKKCINNPVWDTTKQGGNSGSYGGRQQNMV